MYRKIQVDSRAPQTGMEYNTDSQLKLQSVNENEKGLGATGPALDINLALSPGVGSGDSGNLQLFGLMGYGTPDPLSFGALGQYQQQQQQQQEEKSHDGSTSSVFSDSHNHNYSIGHADGNRRSASGNAHSDGSDTNMNDAGQPTSNTSYSSPDGAATVKNGTTGPSEEELYQRRKAQNRAAQRAFRERKEGKIKELSSRLQDAEVSRERLEKQLSELRERNKRLNMENQMLQKQQQFQQQSQTFQPVQDDAYTSPGAREGGGGVGGNDHGLADGLDIQDILSFKFPNTSKYEFIEGTIDWSSHGQENESGYHASKIGESYRHDSNKLLTISAVWDYLVEFANLNEEYTLDIPGIMNELRGKEVCHGFGPAYALQLVNDIVCRHIRNEE